jgi:hypothetical protein
MNLLPFCANLSIEGVKGVNGKTNEKRKISASP